MSNEAFQREREKLYQMTDSHPCSVTIPLLIGDLNRRRKGWTNYFSMGHPTRCAAAVSGRTGLR